MANLTESATYEAGIYQLETSDPVIGGPTGISNAQAKQLANRTKYLKEHVDAIEEGLEDGAILGDGTITRPKLKNGVLPTSIRNCVLTGPVTAAGAANQVVANNANSVVVNGTPTPIRMSFSDGFDDKGQVDYIEKYTTDTTVTINTIPGSGQDVFVFFRRNTISGELTLDADTGPFVVSPVAPTSGQKFWYDTSVQAWREWGGLGWNAVQLVVLARITRSALTVSEIFNYPFRESVEADSAIPAGTIMAMHADYTEPPLGWIHCNGASVSKATYARLYAKLGDTYGSTSTNFTLPDLRGEFLRGLDAGRAVDDARVLGSSQTAKVGNHKHQLPFHHEGDGDLRTISPSPFGTGDNFASTHVNGGGTTTSGSVAAMLTDQPYASTNIGAGDNRPRNVAFPFFIKY